MFPRLRCFCIVLAAIAAAGVRNSAEAAVVYVNTDRFGFPADGTTWATAYGTIQAALNASAPGDHLWVAEGAYLETLILPSNRRLYGGFVGTETARSQRNAAVNITAIDGNGATVSVVDFNGTTTVLVDGFTITGGTATNGAGVRFNGADNTNTLSDCLITDNSGQYGGGIRLDGSSPLIRGCTITDNYALIAGGGILVWTAYPTIENCTISNNVATANAGAGLHFDSSSGGSVTDSLIYGNVNTSATTSSGGGGAQVVNSSNPAFTRCIISNNSGHTGGGVNANIGSPSFTDCVFSGNTASSVAGGVYSRAQTATLINCSFSGNHADGGIGGAMYIVDTSSTTVTNCTFSDNTATQGGAIASWNSDTAIKNTLFYNNTGATIYERTADADPVITNSLFNSNPSGDFFDFDDTITTTGAANLNALAQVDACVDGAPSFVTTLTDTWDGAASYDPVTNTTSATSLATFGSYGPDGLAGSVLSPDTTQYRNFLILSNTTDTVVLAGNATSIIADDDTFKIIDHHIQGGSAAVNTGTNTGAPSTDFDGEARPLDTTTDIGVDEFLDTDDDGTPDVLDSDDDGDGLSDDDELNIHETDPKNWDSDGDGFSDSFELNAGTDPNDIGDKLDVIYVVPGGLGSGASWAHGLGSIQDALDASATSGAPVWVLGGTYYESIHITGEAKLYGGFVGNEDQLEQRDYIANVTKIDVSGMTERAILMTLVSDAVLDGFTVTGGDAVEGAGLYLSTADATSVIANCVFTRNAASTGNGGGALILNSTIDLINCAFINNRANAGAGAGVLLDNSDVAFNNCLVVGNTAFTHGGGIYGINASFLTVLDSYVTNNVAQGVGGGIAAAQLSMDSCTVSGNVGETGGGIYVGTAASTEVFNTVLSGNVATDFGGAMVLANGAPDIVNCTIAGNSAPLTGTGGLILISAPAAVVNVIFTDNTSWALTEHDASADPNVLFCLFNSNPDGDYRDNDTASVLTGDDAINALAVASDNIDSSPVFETGPSGTWTIAAGYNSTLHQTILTDSTASFEPNELVGRLIRAKSSLRKEYYVLENTATTITVAGDASAVITSDPYAVRDYHLSSASGARDTGSNVPISLDFDGEARPFNSTLDIGADEWVDSDGDNLSDYIDPDDDGDGIDDEDEDTYGTDPDDADSDNDGLEDGDEVNTHSTDPLDSDSDDDGLEDGDEVNTYNSDPTETDSDGDTVEDGDEVNVHESDPTRFEVWVDFAWNGALNGTPSEPLNDLAAAIAAVPAQGGIRINGGSTDKISPFTGTISKKLGITSYGGKITIGID